MQKVSIFNDNLLCHTPSRGEYKKFQFLMIIKYATKNVQIISIFEDNLLCHIPSRRSANNFQFLMITNYNLPYLRDKCFWIIRLTFFV